MKKLSYIMFSVLFFSCGEETVEKPKNLLPESEMVNILYDITLLQAINSYQPQTLDSSRVDGKNYIYKKYKTDSLTFAQSHQYYASDLELYESMQKKVTAKIDDDKRKIGIKAKGGISPAIKGGPSPKIRPRTNAIRAARNKAKQVREGKASPE